MALTTVCFFFAAFLYAPVKADGGDAAMLPRLDDTTAAYIPQSQNVFDIFSADVMKLTWSYRNHLGVRASSISDFRYTKVYSMVATAYTAGPESTGKSPGMRGYGITASGMRVKPGVIAVDPRVIPLGTYVYVKGYGYSIAADTGGAIKGKRIDVYMKTLSEAYRWGRRTVNVYILE